MPEQTSNLALTQDIHQRQVAQLRQHIQKLNDNVLDERMRTAECEAEIAFLKNPEVQQRIFFVFRKKVLVFSLQNGVLCSNWELQLLII